VERLRQAGPGIFARSEGRSDAEGVLRATGHRKHRAIQRHGDSLTALLNNPESRRPVAGALEELIKLTGTE
jgi:hypothetical protein